MTLKILLRVVQESFKKATLFFKKMPYLLVESILFHLQFCEANTLL